LQGAFITQASRQFGRDVGLVRVSRRRFIAGSVAAGAGAIVGGYGLTMAMRRMEPLDGKTGTGKVFILETDDRASGVGTLMEQFDLAGFGGQRVALKGNFNSADPFPASTHLDTLRALVEGLKGAGAESLALAERSGIGNTRNVLEKLGVVDLSGELGFEVVVLDELEREGWVKIKRSGSHWLNGFHLPRVLTEADRVVQTCCLKTHGFGGHFTMSLKNSVGLVAKRLPGGVYNYMLELHASPYQRAMIAEVNRYYDTDLIIMDAIGAFVEGGPAHGHLVEPGLMLASKDRVALDAAGVAILRSYGTTKKVMKGPIFGLDQIRRAAELGVGVSSPSEISLVPLNQGASGVSEEIARALVDGS
jgi:uncharacterized protein (DUF362 family)